MGRWWKMTSPPPSTIDCHLLRRTCIHSVQSKGKVTQCMSCNHLSLRIYPHSLDRSTHVARSGSSASTSPWTPCTTPCRTLIYSRNVVPVKTRRCRTACFRRSGRQFEHRRHCILVVRIEPGNIKQCFKTIGRTATEAETGKLKRAEKN